MITLTLTEAEAKALREALDELWDRRSHELDLAGYDQDSFNGSPDDEPLLSIHRRLK